MSKLNEKIWDRNGKIIPMIREKLLILAHKIADDVATLVKIKHIYFTGSLATYKWTATSDIDLHIIVDILEKHSNDTLTEYFDLICKLFNSQHNIFIKGYKVEVNMKDKEVFYQDKAAYDLIKNEWFKKPNKNTKDLNDPEVIKIASEYQDKIDKLISIGDSKERANELKKEIKGLRTSSLAEGGEYSTGNLVFKILRNTEYLAKLFNYSRNLEDRELSLEKFKLHFNTSL
jgi:predicted nucleotidyltransferase